MDDTKFKELLGALDKACLGVGERYLQLVKVKLAALALHDTIGNTTPIAADIHPRVYEALLNLRRELMK